VGSSDLKQDTGSYTRKSTTGATSIKAVVDKSFEDRCLQLNTVASHCC
jgi:hypothetical protein